MSVSSDVFGELETLSGLAFLLNVDSQGLKIADWAKKHHADIGELLDQNGALLVRGLNIISSHHFGVFLSSVFGSELIQYQYRSTPRTELRSNVYTATEYHPSATIPQHNENSYSNSWAMKIGFMCMIDAQSGGETPISDSRVAYRNIPKEIRDEFEAKGVMYVRNYSDIDLPWSEVFQTEDKKEVEEYCSSNFITYEWKEDNGLRTTQVNRASQTHPRTGEKVWFNQAHLFHVSSLETEVRQSLLEEFGEENLPRNAYFGDGSPIDDDALAAIRDVYSASKVKFPWQKNDILLLDNMLFTHGREPYSGERKVLVGMACPLSN